MAENKGLDLEKLKLQTRRAIGGRQPIKDESIKPTNAPYVIPDPEDPKGADDTMLWLQQELDNMDDVSHTVSGVNNLVKGFNNKPVDQSTAEFEGAPEPTFEEFDDMPEEDGEEFASDEVMRSIEEVEGMLDSTPVENGEYVQEDSEEPLDDEDSIEEELNKSEKPAKGIQTPDTIEDVDKVINNLETDLLGGSEPAKNTANTARPATQTGYLPTEDEGQFDIPQEVVKAYDKMAERLLGGNTAKGKDKKSKEPKEGEEETDVDFFTRISDRLSDDNYTGDTDLRSGQGVISNWGKSFAPTEEEHGQAMDRMSAILGSMYNSPGLRPTINIGGGSKTVMQQAPQGGGVPYSSGGGTDVNIPLEEEEYVAEEYIAENPPPTTDDEGSWWPWLTGAAGLVGAGLLASLYFKGTGKKIPQKEMQKLLLLNPGKVPNMGPFPIRTPGSGNEVPKLLNPGKVIKTGPDPVKYPEFGDHRASAIASKMVDKWNKLYEKNYKDTSATTARMVDEWNKLYGKNSKDPASEMVNVWNKIYGGNTGDAIKASNPPAYPRGGHGNSTPQASYNYKNNTEVIPDDMTLPRYTGEMQVSKEGLTSINKRIKGSELLTSSLGLNKNVGKRTPVEKALLPIAQNYLVSGRPERAVERTIAEIKRRLPAEIDKYKQANKVDKLNNYQLGQVITELRKKLESGQ